MDLGFVGEPENITPDIIIEKCNTGQIPVITPLGISQDDITYNINADTAAGGIASALNAKRLLMLTDIVGVLDNNKNLINELKISEAKRLISNGTITGGMIPKIETCLETVSSGVKAAVIIDGRSPHAILREIFTTSGSGTMIE